MNGPAERRLWSPASAVVLALALSACQSSRIAGPDAVTSSSGGMTATALNLGSTANHQLAELRALVAHYRDLGDAMAAGYVVEVTPCLELAGVGGMGFHYGNPAYLAVTEPNYLQPELLLFEPTKNGKLRFVGVE